MQLNHPITPCLWFDDQAEAAATLYCAVFPNSRIVNIAHYPEAGQAVHGKPAGAVMTVAFELNGQPFTALNGGPHFKLDEAVSFQVICDSQAEIDHYWEALTGDGGEEGPCGWLKDRFGLSWQIVPRVLLEWMSGEDRRKAAKAMESFMTMKKYDIAALQRAAEAA